jgi:hypothetical protein
MNSVVAQKKLHRAVCRIARVWATRRRSGCPQGYGSEQNNHLKMCGSYD